MSLAESEGRVARVEFTGTRSDLVGLLTRGCGAPTAQRVPGANAGSTKSGGKGG
jgi:hypothetical protein